MDDSAIEVLDHLGIPAFVVDIIPDGKFIYRKFNRANARMSGRDVEQLKGKSPAEIFPERVSETLIGNFRRVLGAGEALTYESTIPFPAGERRLQTTLSPVKDETGTIYRLIGSSIDMTTQHADIVAELKLDLQSQELTREMEQFVSMAAHDLRSPMRNVQNIAEALRDDFVDHGDGKKELIEMLIKVAESSTALIADVLAYSRARSSTPMHSRFDIGLLCANIFSALDPKDQHHLAGPDMLVEADEVAIQIVLRNLVDNAIKHGGRRSVSVKIGVEPLADGMLRFEVQDNGVGIENPATVFMDGGKFEYGTGFGLLGIRQLITSRGGEVSVEHRDGESGTVFRLTLPGCEASSR